MRRRAPPSADAPAPQALDEGDRLACPLRDLLVPLHDLVHGCAPLDRVLQAGHGHAEELQQPSRLITRHVHVSDRKSTRLNSSHGYISYAVFCLKKKKNKATQKPNTVYRYTWKLACQR